MSSWLYTEWEVFPYYVYENARIFREIKSQDRKFPDRILQDGKFWDQKIPGIPIFHGIQEKKFEKIPGFFSLEGRKFQDFWLHLIPGLKILWQNFPGLFCHLWAFLGKTKTKPCLSWAWPQNPEMGPLSYLHSGLLKSRRRVWILPYCIGDRGWVKYLLHGH